MPSNVAEFFAGIAELATTYLLHSTLLLGAVWVCIRSQKPGSQALTERLWKAAAVLPLVTASAQWAGGYSEMGLNLLLATPDPITFSSGPGPERRDEQKAGVQPGAEPNSVPSGGNVAIAAPASATRYPTHTSVVQLDSSGDPMGAAPSDRPHAILPMLADRLTSGSSPGVGSDAAAPVRGTRATRVPSMEWAGLVAGVAAVAFVCTGLLRIALETVLFRRQLAGSRIVQTGAALDMLRRLARRGRLSRRVVLLVSNVFSEPAAFGLFRWRILLPDGIDQDLPRNELRALLAHELAHLVRGDSWWLWIGRFLCSCLAFQPLNYVARRGWQRAAEYRCDDWAVRHGTDALSLAHCLARIAESRLPLSCPSNALAAAGSRSTLSKRIERLVNGATPRDAWGTPRRARLLVGLGLVVGLIMIAFGPRADLFAEADAAEVDFAHPESEILGSSLEPLSEAADLPESLRHLNADLNELDQRLARMNHLLAREESASAIREIAARARERTDVLQHRRRILLTEWMEYEQDRRATDVFESRITSASLRKDVVR